MKQFSFNMMAWMAFRPRYTTESTFEIVVGEVLPAVVLNAVAWAGMFAVLGLLAGLR